MDTVAAALVAVENSQPEVARLLLDVAAAILQARSLRGGRYHHWRRCRLWPLKNRAACSCCTR